MQEILILNESEIKEYCDCFYNGRLNSLRDSYREAIEIWKKEKNADVLDLCEKQLNAIEKLIKKENEK